MKKGNKDHVKTKPVQKTKGFKPIEVLGHREWLGDEDRQQVEKSLVELGLKHGFDKRTAQRLAKL